MKKILILLLLASPGAFADNPGYYCYTVGEDVKTSIHIRTDGMVDYQEGDFSYSGPLIIYTTRGEYGFNQATHYVMKPKDKSYKLKSFQDFYYQFVREDKTVLLPCVKLEGDKVFPETTTRMYGLWEGMPEGSILESILAQAKMHCPSARAIAPADFQTEYMSPQVKSTVTQVFACSEN